MARLIPDFPKGIFDLKNEKWQIWLGILCDLFPPLATKASMEAESDVLVTADLLKNHPGVPKAWVNFNGTGTVAIRTSHNVSSITDNGTGDYTVNFTTAFSSTDYCASYMTNAGVARVCAINTMAAGSFRFNSHDSGAGNVDTSIINLSFSGDQ